MAVAFAEAMVFGFRAVPGRTAVFGFTVDRIDAAVLGRAAAFGFAAVRLTVARAARRPGGTHPAGWRSSGSRSSGPQ